MCVHGYRRQSDSGYVTACYMIGCMDVYVCEVVTSLDFFLAMPPRSSPDHPRRQHQ